MSINCRTCGANSLQPILSLGKTPLANALLTAETIGESESAYPLDLVFCPACALVQITESVPPEILFDDYAYFSSFSDTAVLSARRLAEWLTGERRLGAASPVLEVASNDGYLLQHYRDLGVPVLGIEPAANVARVAQGNGTPTRCEFFGRRLAEKLAAEGRRADVLHANNVLAQVPDLNGVAAGIGLALKPGGLAVVEVPYLQDLLVNGYFDTIYHEHLCYFSLTPLVRLFARHGLAVADVEHTPIHGGSLRLFVTPGGGPPSYHVQDMLAAERPGGLLPPDYYRDFAARIEALKQGLVALLRQLRADGRRIAAYGAAAKGSTLLNVFGMGADGGLRGGPPHGEAGAFTPGTHLAHPAPPRRSWNAGRTPCCCSRRISPRRSWRSRLPTGARAGGSSSRSRRPGSSDSSPSGASYALT